LSESDVVLLAGKMREPMYETLVLFAAWTGMRAGEIEALRIKRINLTCTWIAGSTTPNVWSCRKVDLPA